MTYAPDNASNARVPRSNASPVGRGFLSAEIVAALGLTVILLTLTAVSTLQYVKARHEADLRRTLRLTAVAELERLRAGAADLPGPDGRTTEMLPPGTRLTVRSEPGQGAWSDFVCVHVSATRTRAGGRPIAVGVSAYLPARGAP